MKKPVVGIEQDVAGQRYLTVVCPDCEKTNRYPFATLEAGQRLSCSCGVGFNLSQQNYEELQERFGLGQEEEAEEEGKAPERSNPVN